MKQLFLTASLLFLIFAGSNAQTKKSESNKPECSVLPTEQQWKAAAKTKSPDNTPYSLNNLHSLPTEAEWIQAAAKTKSPDNTPYSLNNLHALPTEAEWIQAAASDKRLKAKKKAQTNHF